VGNNNSKMELQAISELFLAALRSAALRAKLDANEIEAIDTALKSGLITPEYAMVWLHDIGLVDQVIVIGTHKFVYDIWGDTVNTASRMESHSLPGRIQVSQTTRNMLKNSFTFERRGAIEIKGKG
jgi:hypothetical protein